MSDYLYGNTETKRALREIIFTIIETNILDMENIELQNQLVEKILTSFQKKVYFSKGMFVELVNDKLNILIIVNVKGVSTIITDLIQLQKMIVKDVQKLTGIKLTAINIKVNNLM